MEKDNPFNFDNGDIVKVKDHNFEGEKLAFGVIVDQVTKEKPDGKVVAIVGFTDNWKIYLSSYRGLNVPVRFDMNIKSLIPYLKGKDPEGYVDSYVKDR